MKKLLPIALVSMIMLAHPAFAQDADYNARVDAAKAYLAAVPVQRSVDSVFEAMGKNPQSHLSAYDLSDIKSFVDVSAIQKTSLDALVKTFTVDELKAMATFYSSPAGQSVMKKMPDYTKELMPSIQAQIRSAVIAHLQKQNAAATSAAGNGAASVTTPAGSPVVTPATSTAPAASATPAKP